MNRSTPQGTRLYLSVIATAACLLFVLAAIFLFRVLNPARFLAPPAGSYFSTAMPRARVIPFLESASLGRLYLHSWEPKAWPEWQEFGEAVGTVTIAEGFEVWLQVSKAGIGHLDALNGLENDSLQWLSIEGVRDQFDLEPLEQLSGLVMLDLHSTLVNDEELEHISQMDNLRSLDLARTRVSDTGLTYLANLSSLKELNICGNPNITSEGIVHLENLTNLERLFLSETSVDDQAIPSLAKLTSLRLLDTSYSRISLEGERKLKVALRKTDIVHDRK